MHMSVFYYYYFAVAVRFKRCDFLALQHYNFHIKDMKQRTVGMGSKHSNIYQNTYQHAWMNIFMKVIYLSSISLWYRLFVWKLLKLSFFSFTSQVAKGFPKSVWTCYFCLQMSFTQVLQRYHSSIINETTDQSSEFHVVLLISLTQLASLAQLNFTPV